MPDWLVMYQLYKISVVLNSNSYTLTAKESMIESNKIPYGGFN